MKNVPLYNLIIMSIAFLVLFAAFNLSNYIQKIVANSLNEANPGLDWDPYLASCIVYGVFSFGNFLVPSIHTLIDYKSCLFIGSFFYFIFSLIYFFPFKNGLYLASIIVGLGASILWTTQGNYLSMISTPETINKNANIFWCIYQFSLIFGNLYYYIQFQGVEKIENTDRIRTFSFISILSLIATLMFLFLKKNKIKSQSDKKINSIDAFKGCLNLFKTKKIILLSISCFYTGIEQTFFGGIFPSVVAFTKQFGYDSKKYSGLYGCFAGIGAIGGTFVFGIILNRYLKHSRISVYSIGFLAQMISFVLIYLNHPNNSTIDDTNEIGIIKPRIWIAMFCGSMLCLGDGLFNTQLLALIGTVYNNTSDLSSAFALYKFTHSLGASVAFFYASFDLTLYTHLIILFIFNLLNIITYYLAERLIKEEEIKKENVEINLT